MLNLHTDLERCLHRLDELNLDLMALHICRAIEALREHMEANGVELPPRPAGLWSVEEFSRSANREPGGDELIGPLDHARQSGPPITDSVNHEVPPSP